MSTSNDTPPTPRRLGRVAPAWLAVLGQRLGFSRRRGLPRAARIAGRTLWGLARLLAAVELVAVIKAGPELRSAASSPLWGQYAAAVLDRVLGWKTYLGAAAALGLAYLVFAYLPDWMALVAVVLAVPALVIFLVPVVRRFYRRCTYARTRAKFGLDGWADFWELHWGVSAHAVRHVAVTQRPLVAATLPTVPSRHHVGTVAVAAAKLRRHALIERLPVTECGTWLGRSAVGPWWGVETFAAFRDVVGLIAPPQTGKAIDCAEEVLTPSGWTTMGALEVGDEVYHPDGHPVRVTEAHPVRVDRPCYRVTTTDGRTLVVDEEHLWTVRDRARRGGGTGQNAPAPWETVTTAGLLARGVLSENGKRANGPPHRAYRFVLPRQHAITSKPVELPVDPYLLGLWLGAGSSTSSRLTVGNVDLPYMVAAIEDCGVRVVSTRRDRTAWTVWFALNAKVRDGFESRCRRLGVWGNKHIPDLYLTAGLEQRLALLQGLLDTDGTMEITRRCHRASFTSCRRNLAAGVLYLARSLGWRATIREKAAVLAGREVGRCWNVSFTPGRNDSSPFRLPRKVDSARTTDGRGDELHTVSIASIDPVESRPVRCIRVSRGDGLFLAGRDLVATHNTALMTHHVIDHPGAVISTSTKPDIYLYTALLRQARFGKDSVALFNPDNLGWLGSTLRWDPVRGCADFRTAHTRAGLLVGARDKQDNDDGRWDEWATEVLAGMLIVADLLGRTMRDIARWCHNENDETFGPREALQLMRGLGNQSIPEGVVDALSQILASKAQKTSASVFFALRGAVGFMSDPTVAALCTPGRDEPVFDVDAFLAQRGTLYLLGSEDQNAATAPLLAAFTGYVFDTAKVTAARSGRKLGRLDPPLLISLDEAALITPVPLPKWVADAGGRGIHIIWSVQTPSQLRERWGDEGADTILNATNALLIFGGLKKKSDLEEVSEWCGHRHELVPDPDGPDQPGHAKFERVPVCPPGLVREVPQWHFLLVYRSTKTTLCRMWPAWKRRDVKRAGFPTGAPLPAPTSPGTGPRDGQPQPPTTTSQHDSPPTSSRLPAAAAAQRGTPDLEDVDQEGTAA